MEVNLNQDGYILIDNLLIDAKEYNIQRITFKKMDKRNADNHSK